MMPVREDIVEMDDIGMVVRSAGRWPIGYRRHAELVHHCVRFYVSYIYTASNRALIMVIAI